MENIYRWDLTGYGSSLTYQTPDIMTKEAFMDFYKLTTDEEITEHFKSRPNTNYLIGTKDDFDKLDDGKDPIDYVGWKGAPGKTIYSYDWIRNGVQVIDWNTYALKSFIDSLEIKYFYYELDGIAYKIFWNERDYLVDGRTKGTPPKFEDLVPDKEAIELTKDEYDKLFDENDKKANQEQLAQDSTFHSKLQIAEQSVFGLLNMHMEGLNTEIGIRQARAILGTISVLEDWADGKTPTDADKGLLTAAKAYITSNGTDHTKVNDLKQFGMWLAVTQSQRITTMYNLVINNGEELSKAWKDSLAKAEVESPIAKVGETLTEDYSKNVLGEDLYNKLASIFQELDLGTTMPEITKAVVTKTLALAPKSPTDTGTIV